MTRVTELTRSRAFHGLTEDDCLIWFGVGPGTLERIEAGEVEPSDELEQRIVRFLRVAGGSLSPFSSAVTPGPPHAMHSGGPTGGAAGSCSAHPLDEPARKPPVRAATFGRGS